MINERKNKIKGSFFSVSIHIIVPIYIYLYIYYMAVDFYLYGLHSYI